jgi:hypothetical protein
MGRTAWENESGDRKDGAGIEVMEGAVLWAAGVKKRRISECT